MAKVVGRTMKLNMSLLPLYAIKHAVERFLYTYFLMFQFSKRKQGHIIKLNYVENNFKF